MLEKVAEFDDALMEKYFDDPSTITEEEILRALRNATVHHPLHRRVVHPPGGKILALFDPSDGSHGQLAVEPVDGGDPLVQPTRNPEQPKPPSSRNLFCFA